MEVTYKHDNVEFVGTDCPTSNHVGHACECGLILYFECFCLDDFKCPNCAPERYGLFKENVSLKSLGIVESQESKNQIIGEVTEIIDEKAAWVKLK